MLLPFPNLPTMVGVTIFCAVMAFASYNRKVFDLSGSLTAFAVGMVIGICGSVLWLVLLLVFLLTSFGLTKYRYDWKKAQGFQEGKKGERTWRNVAANGAIPSPSPLKIQRSCLLASWLCGALRLKMTTAMAPSTQSASWRISRRSRVP